MEISKDDHEAIMESMLNGTFEEHIDDSEENNVTIEDEEVTDQEDTDQHEESESDEHLDEDLDGDVDEDSDDSDDDEEEDTLVETNGDESNDEDEEEEDEFDEDSESDDVDLDDEDQDNTENEEESDGTTSGKADEIDYKAFYDAVTNTEFVVNGKKTKGFRDPKKIIQSQQMAGGFSDKMAGFKKYRPYMAPLKERGMLEDTEKFNLAMKLIDGDQEALKQHLKNLNIDPLDIEMDEINYTNTNTLASQEQLVLEDSLEAARAAGIEDQVRTVIGERWDQESFNTYLEDPQVRSDLMDHIQSGAYDYVQERIEEFKRLDTNGSFSAMTSIDQYRAAAKDIQKELAVEEAQAIARQAREKTQVQQTPTKDVQVEKANIAKKRKETAYKAKAEEQKAKVAAQRKKAASLSKKKKSAPKKVEEFDPLKLSDEDTNALMAAMINGDIK